MKSGLVLRDRKFIIFAGLVLLLILVNARQWGRGSGVSSNSKDVTRNQEKSTIQQDPILIADQLGVVKPEFHEEKRNIFSFFQERLERRMAQGDR